MLALGDVTDVVSSGKTGFDVLGFLGSVVLKQLTSDGTILIMYWLILKLFEENVNINNYK